MLGLLGLHARRVRLVAAAIAGGSSREHEHPACGAAVGALLGGRGAFPGGGVVPERRPAASADAVRDARRAPGDRAQGPDARRAVPGVRRVRREQGQGALQGRLLPRLLRRPHGLAPRLPGW